MENQQIAARDLTPPPSETGKILSLCNNIIAKSL
jgi:hypothetical protein